MCILQHSTYMCITTLYICVYYNTLHILHITTPYIYYILQHPIYITYYNILHMCVLQHNICVYYNTLHISSIGGLVGDFSAHFLALRPTFWWGILQPSGIACKLVLSSWAVIM